MTEHKVNSFAKLHEILSSYRKDNRWQFRGHSNTEWELIPKVGRAEFPESDDEKIFRAWKRRAVEFVSVPYGDDWGWLSIAQHHGLATRLLDWTFNPLAAAYFAVSENYESDAVIFAYRTSWFIDTKEEANPFEVSGIKKFKPTGVAQRIVRQGGLFTIHENPDISMEKAIEEGNIIEKIIIENHYRKELMFELSHYGINKATLFPDLDGLSAYINWATANRTYWTIPTEELDVE